MLPPSSTQSGTPAALASASQAGHVEPGKRDHRHPLIADEMQRLAGSFVKVDRSEPAAFEQFAEIVKRGNELAHRLGDIWLKVCASNHALFRIEIDQDQRPVGERWRYAPLRVA